ncbi:hypothetical protein NBRC10513_003603 [Rhodotorula toruloides]
MGIRGFFQLAREAGAMVEEFVRGGPAAVGRVLAGWLKDRNTKLLLLDVSSLTGHILVQQEGRQAYEDRLGERLPHYQAAFTARTCAHLHALLLPIRAALPDLAIHLVCDHLDFRPSTKEPEIEKREKKRLAAWLMGAMQLIKEVRRKGKNHIEHAQRLLEKAGFAEVRSGLPQGAMGLHRVQAEEIASCPSASARWLRENVLLVTAPSDADGHLARAALAASSPAPSSRPHPVHGLVEATQHLDLLAKQSVSPSRILTLAGDSDLSANTGSGVARFFARINWQVGGASLGVIDKHDLSLSLSYLTNGVEIANAALAMGQDSTGSGILGLGIKAVVNPKPEYTAFATEDWGALTRDDKVEEQRLWDERGGSVEKALKVKVPEKPWGEEMRVFRGYEGAVVSKMAVMQRVWVKVRDEAQARNPNPAPPRRHNLGKPASTPPRTAPRRPKQRLPPSPQTHSVQVRYRPQVPTSADQLAALDATKPANPAPIVTPAETTSGGKKRKRESSKLKVPSVEAGRQAKRRKKEGKEADTHEGREKDDEPAGDKEKVPQATPIRDSAPTRTRRTNLKNAVQSADLLFILRLANVIFTSVAPVLISSTLSLLLASRKRFDIASIGAIRLAQDCADCAADLFKLVNLVLDLTLNQSRQGTFREASLAETARQELGGGADGPAVAAWVEEWSSLTEEEQSVALERSLLLGDVRVAKSVQQHLDIPPVIAFFLLYPGAQAILKDLVTQASTAVFVARKARVGRFVNDLVSSILLRGVNGTLSIDIDKATAASRARLAAACHDDPALEKEITYVCRQTFLRTPSHIVLPSTELHDTLSTFAQSLSPDLEQRLASTLSLPSIDELASVLVLCTRVASRLIVEAADATARAQYDEDKAVRPKNLAQAGSRSRWRDSRHEPLVEKLVDAGLAAAGAGRPHESAWSANDCGGAVLAGRKGLLDLSRRMAKRNPSENAGSAAQGKDEEEGEADEEDSKEQAWPMRRSSFAQLIAGGASTLVSPEILLFIVEEQVSRTSASVAQDGDGRLLSTFLPTHAPMSAADACSLISSIAEEPVIIPRVAAALKDYISFLSRIMSHDLKTDDTLGKSRDAAEHFHHCSQLLSLLNIDRITLSQQAPIAAQDRTLHSIAAQIEATWSGGVIHVGSKPILKPTPKQILRLASGDQLEAFRIVFPSFKLPHFPRGSVTFSHDRLHVHILRIDTPPPYLLTSLYGSAAAIPPKLTVGCFLRDAYKSAKSAKYFTGLALPPARLVEQQSPSTSSTSTFFDENDQPLDRRLAECLVTPRQMQVKPALSTLPSVPWLGGNNLVELRRFLGLQPDGSSGYDKNVLVIALDLGSKNVGVGCAERPAIPGTLMCIRVRDGVFLGSERELQRRAEQKATVSGNAGLSKRTAFDCQRQREKLLDQVAHEFVSEAVKTPPHGVGWPAIEKVVVAIGGGDIEAAFGQRGSKAAGPFVSSIVQHFEAQFGKGNVVARIVNEAYTSSRCVRLTCRKKDNKPLVKYVWTEGPRKGRQFYRILYCADCERTINRDEVGGQNILTNVLSAVRFGFGAFTAKFAARMGLKWKGIGDAAQMEGKGEGEGAPLADQSLPADVRRDLDELEDDMYLHPEEYVVRRDAILSRVRQTGS